MFLLSSASCFACPGHTWAPFAFHGAGRPPSTLSWTAREGKGQDKSRKDRPRQEETGIIEKTHKGNGNNNNLSMTPRMDGVDDGLVWFAKNSHFKGMQRKVFGSHHILPFIMLNEHVPMQFKWTRPDDDYRALHTAVQCSWWPVRYYHVSGSSIPVPPSSVSGKLSSSTLVAIPFLYLFTLDRRLFCLLSWVPKEYASAYML